jgi:two-component system response regulator AtoC
VSVLPNEIEEQCRMVGNSKALELVRDLIGLVAPTTAGVLITGESGAGKETVARAIHVQGPRAAEPFVALGCDAIPKELFESVLFGQERGTSADAEAGRKGKLREADKGTLFLPEVSDIPLAAQARLSRFLEHPEAERPGSSGPGLLDVRVMAATNKDLVGCIKGGSFREDLFHRLNVVTIRVPALRERPEDIEALTAFFLERFCRRNGRAVSLAPECMTILRSHDWPGNVRELRNMVERAVVLSRSNPVEPDELRSLLGGDATGRRYATLGSALGRPDRVVLERTLAAAHDRPHTHRRRHRNKLSHRVSRWLKKVPRRTMATGIVALVFVLALLLMLIWKWLTGEWLVDTIMGMLGGLAA